MIPTVNIKTKPQDILGKDQQKLKREEKIKTLIIYTSIHHSNTEKIAKAMAEILDADLLKPRKVDADALSKYDLIGFGSGIYFWKHHKSLLDLVDDLIVLNKKAFVFSTRGIGPVWVYHRPLKKRLREKGFDIIGEFSCRGFDTVGPLKLIGGINKGRPNGKDLEHAENFAKSLLENLPRR